MFLQTLIRVLAGHMDVEVRYTNDSTFSIGRTAGGKLVVNLARRLLAVRGESEENLGLVFRGALAHEALGHGYHTDFSPAAEAKEGPYAANLANIFEDVRIEKAAPERFIGARRLLAEMVEYFDSIGWWRSREGDWQSALNVALLRKYRRTVLGQKLDAAPMIEAEAFARQALGDALYDQIDAIAEKACRSDSTMATSNAADEIVRLLRKEQDQRQKQQPQQSAAGDPGAQGGEGGGGSDASKDADDGQAGNTSGQAEDGEDAGDGKPSSGNGQPGQDDGEGAQSGAAGNGDAGDGSDADGRGNGGGGGESKPQFGFDDKAVDDCSVEGAVNAASSGLRDAGFSAADMTDASAGVGEKAADRSNQPQNETTLDTSLVRTIASKIETAIRAVTEDEDDEESEMGALDTSKLARAVKGFEEKPFLVPGRPGSGVNTEILLMVDSSDSTKPLAVFIREIMAATIAALGKFAPDLGVTVALFDGAPTLLIKPGQVALPAVAKAAAACFAPNGGTQWAASVVPLISTLAMSHRMRKVIVTITDGQLLPVNADLMEDLRSQKIETSFVSIGHPLPPGYKGIQCEATKESFANALCDSVLDGILPEFV